MSPPPKIQIDQIDPEHATNPKNSEINKLLDLVMHKRQPTFLEMMINLCQGIKWDESRILLKAVQGKHEEAVFWLFKKNIVSVNRPGAFKQTPLHLAVENRSEPIVKLLLQVADMDVNLTNSMGETALHIACKKQNIAVLTLLLGGLKLDVNKSDTCNKPPLHTVCSHNFYEEAKILIGHPEIDLLPRNIFGQTQVWDPIYEMKKSKWFDLCREADKRISSQLFNPETLFALIVYLCDGYFDFNQQRVTSEQKRFFIIVQRLPIELQMIMSLRVFDKL